MFRFKDVSSKKLITCALALALTSALQVLVSNKKTEAYQTVGTSNNADTATNRELLWVYNNDAVAHGSGSLVVWHNPSGSEAGVAGLSVSTTTTNNDGLVAGAVADSSLGATSYGFIQTHGYISNLKIAVANTAGDALVSTGTAEQCGVYSVAQATGSAANQSNIYGVFGTALNTTTSSTTVKAFIRL